MNATSEEILRLVQRRSYEEAYSVGKAALEKMPNNEEVIESLKY